MGSSKAPAQLVIWDSVNNRLVKVVQNQLHLHAALNEGKEQSMKPYHILRIKISK